MKAAIRSRLLRLLDGAAQLESAVEALRQQSDVLRERGLELARIVAGRRGDAQRFDWRNEANTVATAVEYRRLVAEQQQIDGELEHYQQELAAALRTAQAALQPCRSLVGALVTAPVVINERDPFRGYRAEQLRALILREPGEPLPAGSRRLSALGSLLDDDHPAGAGLRKIRAEITALDAEAAAVREAALPMAEVEERLRQCVDATLRWNPLGQFELLRQPPSRDGRPFVFAFDVTPALLFALDRERYTELALAHLRTLAGDDGGLTGEARTARLEKIVTKRVQLEEREEREVLGLESNGHYVIRREDIDTRLVLRIWGTA